MDSTSYVFAVQHCKATNEFNILRVTSDLKKRNRMLRLRYLVAYNLLSSYSHLRCLNQSDMNKTVQTVSNKTQKLC